MENWLLAATNLASGSLGVIVTLAFTGWWNYSDRRETRRVVERDFVFQYVCETSTLCRELVFQVQISPRERREGESPNFIEEETKILVGTITRLSELHSQLRTVVEDEVIRRFAEEALQSATRVYGVLGIGGLQMPEDFQISENAPMEEVLVAKAKYIDMAICRMYQVYSANNARIGAREQDLSHRKVVFPKHYWCVRTWRIWRNGTYMARRGCTVSSHELDAHQTTSLPAWILHLLCKQKVRSSILLCSTV